MGGDPRSEVWSEGCSKPVGAEWYKGMGGFPAQGLRLLPMMVDRERPVPSPEGHG